MKPGFVVRVITLLMAAIFIFPTIVVAGTSFNAGQFVVFPPKGWSLKWYQQIFETGAWTDAFYNSVKVAALAGILAMLVGTMLAFAAVRGRVLPQSLITSLAVLPIVVPTVVSGIGFYIVAIRVDLSGGVLGLALAHSTLGVPYVFINVIAALTAVDGHVEEAARVCGANEWVTMLRVTLPLIAPAAVIGGVLAFIGSWDEVIIAGFLTSPTFHTLPVVIYGDVRSGAQPSTSAVATMVTIVSILMLGAAAGIPALRGRIKLRGRSARRQAA
jgi:putative spermidine/putrescine transport system permease protein